MTIKIIVDNREKKLIPIIKSLNEDYDYNYEIVIDKLDIGDIIIKKDSAEFGARSLASSIVLMYLNPADVLEP